MRLLPTPQDQAREELRLGIMLRDKLTDTTGARLAFERGRVLDPLNLELSRELADMLEAPARILVLSSTATRTTRSRANVCPS